MNVNHVERALDTVKRLLEARAALQSILRDRYASSVKHWVNAIQEARRNTGKTALEILNGMAERETDGMMLLMMLAATLEVIEEEARCAGAA